MRASRSVRLACIVTFLVVAVPAEAEAQGRDCAGIRALTNADGRKFADLRFNVDSKSGFSVRVGNAKPAMTGLDGCEVSYGQSDIALSCEWEFPDYTTAVAFFDPMVEKMRRCLKVPLPSAEITTRTPGWLIMRSNEADLEAGKDDTHIELRLIEFTPDAADSAPRTTYHVYLESEWSLD